jgi:molybdenum cofactor guanylyltransferase
MGTAKALLPFGAEVMLTRVVRIVRSGVVGPIVVVAAPGQELPPLPGDVLTTLDEREGRGPLEGLRAGLKALAGRCDVAYATSCDVPLLRPAFVRRVCESVADHDAAVPRTDGFLHPLAAAYRVAVVLPHVEALLAADKLRPAFLFDLVKTRVLDEADLRDVDPQLDSLRNLNAPDDYRAALRDAGLA